MNATFGRKDISDGQLWIRKPGKMRWDYYGKKQKDKPLAIAKHFISNGTYLYVVDRENKQVIKKDLQKNLLPTAVTFLYGKGDPAADFTPAIDKSGTYGAKSDHVLKLTPPGAVGPVQAPVPGGRPRHLAREGVDHHRLGRQHQPLPLLRAGLQGPGQGQLVRVRREEPGGEELPHRRRRRAREAGAGHRAAGQGQAADRGRPGGPQRPRPRLPRAGGRRRGRAPRGAARPWRFSYV
ncbi:MAG: outer membrane lipoprotein carrier protein LolA [Kofleriaceae bacterium]|nr:outer membrane lipoprotein carrier protein LolA [Kofleriaceae bacterium]